MVIIFDLDGVIQDYHSNLYPEAKHILQQLQHHDLYIVSHNQDPKHCIQKHNLTHYFKDIIQTNQAKSTHINQIKQLYPPDTEYLFLDDQFENLLDVSVNCNIPVRHIPIHLGLTLRLLPPVILSALPLKSVIN